MRPRNLTLSALIPLVVGLGLAVPSCRPAEAGMPVLDADVARFDPALAEAIESARERVRERYEDGAAWGRLGIVYEANLVAELASAAYAEASARAPDEPKWWYRAAVLHSQAGRLDEAIAAFSRTAQETESFAPAHWRLGFALFEAGDLERARQAFERATDIDADDAAGWGGLARVHLQSDRHDAALSALRSALRVRPEDPYLHALLGTAYRRVGRMFDAAQHLERGLGAQPRWSDPWEQEVVAARVETAALAQVQAARLMDAGRTEESLARLEELLRERPEDLKLLTGIGTAYGRVGRLADARGAYEAALAVEPGNRLARVNLAAVLGRMGELDEGLSHADDALRRGPTFARAHEIRGTLLFRLGRTAEAVDAYREALGYDERDANVRLGLGMFQLELARWSDAARTFERAAEVDGVRVDALVGLAKARVMLNELDAAEDALRRLGDDAPSDARLLAQVRAELGKRRRAENGR